MTISKSMLLLHYKRPDIQKEIVRTAFEKEAVGSYQGQGYAKRPDTLSYPSDILELAKRGITSFHISEEIWTNPLRLGSDMNKKEVEELRKGWDLVLDIDCKELDYSKIAAHYVIQALKHHGINALSCKFSGNHGFHIGVPFEAFPSVVNGQETKTLFPEAPKRIALYLKEFIRDKLAADLLRLNDAKKIAEKAEKKFEEVVVNGKFDPFAVLDIDTILISPRHLCRSVYSFNEKSGLVSIPVDPEKVIGFNKREADFTKVNVDYNLRFLDRDKSVRGEAERLFVQAFDFSLPKELVEQEEEDLNKAYQSVKKFGELTERVPEQFFPPCVKNVLKGLKDGRKRGMFILVNFLTCLGWNHEEAGELLRKWNERNDEPLREVYIKGHLRYHKQNKKRALPPNCDNKDYYKDLGFCAPDGFCKYIKNPVSYAKKKARALQRMKEKEEAKENRKMTEEQKQRTKETREKHKKFREEMKDRLESQ